jgi:ribokinase
VIVKTGATGAALAEGDRVVQVPTLQVEAIDETGAGDVFVAALAVCRAEGSDWDTATRFANAASALSVADRGLMLPSRADVDRAVAGLVDPTVQVL